MSNLNARIMKVTALFGGLQATNILCSVARAKLVAIWIGGAGLGLFGLFNSALELIYAVTQLGIRQSAVRDMAGADPSQRSRIAWTIRRWSIMLGLAGAALTLLFSRPLSILSFGTPGYRWAFACLSIIVFLSAVNQGEGAIFQGLQRFRKLAVCSMLGSLGGLAVSIPMFYFWRIDSIVPSIIAYGVVTWIAMGYYREPVPRPEGGISIGRTIALGKHFMMLGVYMTVTAVATNLISYGFMAYLNNYADISVTGYYNAGFTLVNRYVGLVFTAISMEYFPRLASVARSRHRTGVFVSNQIYLAVAVIVPVALLFIAASPLVVRLLYDREFLVIVPFVVWAMTGTVLRAVSWCMAFVIVARGDGKIYLSTEILSCVISITLNVWFFNLWGFAGLGYAYAVWYGLYTLITGYVYFRHYGLEADRNLAVFLACSLGATCGGAFLATAAAPVWALLPAAASCLVSWKILRRKIGRR